MSYKNTSYKMIKRCINCNSVTSEDRETCYNPKCNPAIKYYIGKFGIEKTMIFLSNNIWQAGEVERDIKYLKKVGYNLKSLGYTLKALRITQPVGIYPNTITYINYTYVKES